MQDTSPKVLSKNTFSKDKIDLKEKQNQSISENSGPLGIVKAKALSAKQMSLLELYTYISHKLM